MNIALCKVRHMVVVIEHHPTSGFEITVELASGGIRIYYTKRDFLEYCKPLIFASWELDEFERLYSELSRPRT